MRIIVGLGNPGKKYELTRHNAGFMAVDRLAEKYGLCWEMNKKVNCQIARGNGILLAKPLAYMNNSGPAVAKILSYYKLWPIRQGGPDKPEIDLTGLLTVVHDDLDIALGKIKKSAASGSAGHNGVESIISTLRTKKINRIRIGIGTGGFKPDAEKYVLERFSQDELAIIQSVIREISEQLLPMLSAIQKDIRKI